MITIKTIFKYAPIRAKVRATTFYLIRPKMVYHSSLYTYFDEYTREGFTIHLERNIRSTDVMKELKRLVVERGG